MSETLPPPQERITEVIVRTENQREEKLREQFLEDNLFHFRHVLNPEISSTDLDRLEQDLVAEKRDKNMGERFELALSEKYLGKIHVVELGSTTNPGKNGEIDGLKTQYLDLLDWMVTHGITEGEKKREESGRTISCRRPLDEAARLSMTIMVRNRPLVETSIEHAGQLMRVGIGKRMVFGVPNEKVKFFFIDGNDNTITDERKLSAVETLFLSGNANDVLPIRTAYYLITDVVNQWAQ